MSAGLPERVAQVYGELGPGERRVADFVLDHLAEVPGYSGAELAEASGTSKATVSRFFRRLGFETFAQARAHARDRARTRGAPVGGLPGGDPLAAHLEHERRALDALALALAGGTVAEVAALVAAARRVLVVGWRNSYPVALHLREQLLQARADVGLAPQPGQTVAEEVAALGERDVLVVVAFRRRTPAVGELLRAAAALEVPCVLLADPGARALHGLVRHRLEVPLGGPGAFDSYAAPMAVAAVLAEAVLARCGRGGRERVAAVARAHEALGELDGA
ncbi:MurR/RpiR family transcriptional regulator [Kineococcus indalonis]|uniref:MurR/RpiR family transcriptional regulator n=1 Tax=Kineococcus indalonis TaxID=2696566 RepID=UPI0014126BC0|nr:SIS domain-containing protein [Kineococcus indalonis]NAZ84672.1 SIS domain-containing protein [Kineococcus indalonis]